MGQVVSAMYVPVYSFAAAVKRRLSYLRVQKEALIAQKRAEIAAKLAVMRSGSNTAFASPVSRTPAPAQTPSPGPSAASAHFAEDVGKRIAEAKRKVSEAQNKLAVKDNPYMVFLPFPSQTTVAKCELFAVIRTVSWADSQRRTCTARRRPQDGGPSAPARLVYPRTAI